MPQPLVVFKAYATNTLFYTIRVWRTRKELRDHCHWVRLCRRTIGLCSTHVITNYAKGKPKKSPDCGEINVCLPVTAELIAHELQHAILGLARRRRWKLDAETTETLVPQDSGEERTAEAYGRIFADTTNKLHRLGIWPTLDRRLQKNSKKKG